jgi:hypothetical protein
MELAEFCPICRGPKLHSFLDASGIDKVLISAEINEDGDHHVGEFV